MEHLNKVNELSLFTHYVAVQLDDPSFDFKIIEQMCKIGTISFYVESYQTFTFSFVSFFY